MQKSIPGRVYLEKRHSRLEFPLEPSRKTWSAQRDLCRAPVLLNDNMRINNIIT